MASLIQGIRSFAGCALSSICTRTKQLVKDYPRIALAAGLGIAGVAAYSFAAPAIAECLDPTPICRKVVEIIPTATAFSAQPARWLGERIGILSAPEPLIQTIEQCEMPTTLCKQGIEYVQDALSSASDSGSRALVALKELTAKTVYTAGAILAGQFITDRAVKSAQTAIANNQKPKTQELPSRGALVRKSAPRRETPQPSQAEVFRRLVQSGGEVLPTRIINGRPILGVYHPNPNIGTIFFDPSKALNIHDALTESLHSSATLVKINNSFESDMIFGDESQPDSPALIETSASNTSQDDPSLKILSNPDFDSFAS